MTQIETDDWYCEEAATFGDRLAAAREDAGLSQAGLAARLGVKESTMRAWEEDLKEPRANRLQMLSGMLNISISWLLTGQGDGPDGPIEEGELSGDVSALLTEMRQLRTEMLQASEKMGRLEKRLRKALRDG